MSTMTIGEYSELGFGRVNIPAPVVAEPALVDQNVSFTGTAGTSAAFGANTRFIRVHVDGVAAFRVGLNPTAVTTDKRMAAGQTEYFAVTPGQKISAITTT